ncbi:hypothetical protein HBI73_248400 [Parastagonospora nodorum]|nr:hypothetical protein HBI73_248400 [Parastagonospora nodorum]
MYFSSIATSMLLATAVSASPLLEQRKAHPEVIPGPGLPSLASLGLTTAQLYETPVPGELRLRRAFIASYYIIRYSIIIYPQVYLHFQWECRA